MPKKTVPHYKRRIFTPCHGAKDVNEAVDDLRGRVSYLEEIVNYLVNEALPNHSEYTHDGKYPWKNGNFARLPQDIKRILQNSHSNQQDSKVK